MNDRQNIFRMVRCPTCGEVEISPSTYTFHKGKEIPTGGVCPKCRHTLGWSHKDTSLVPVAIKING